MCFFFFCADMTCLYFDLLLFISSVRLAFALPLSFFIFLSSSILILLSISLSRAHTHTVSLSLSLSFAECFGGCTLKIRESCDPLLSTEMLHCKTQRKITRVSESDASDATKQSENVYFCCMALEVLQTGGSSFQKSNSLFSLDFKFTLIFPHLPNMTYTPSLYVDKHCKIKYFEFVIEFTNICKCLSRCLIFIPILIK